MKRSEPIAMANPCGRVTALESATSNSGRSRYGARNRISAPSILSTFRTVLRNPPRKRSTPAAMIEQESVAANPARTLERGSSGQAGRGCVLMRESHLGHGQRGCPLRLLYLHY